MDSRGFRPGLSIPELFQQTFGNASGLVGSLGKLAAAEMAEGVGSVAKGAAAAIAGIGAALIGLLFLLHAAVAFLVLRGFTEAASYATVGGGIIVIGLLAVLLGVKLCMSANPVPTRTLREVRTLLGHKDVVS